MINDTYNKYKLKQIKIVLNNCKSSSLTSLHSLK